VEKAKQDEIRTKQEQEALKRMEAEQKRLETEQKKYREDKLTDYQKYVRWSSLTDREKQKLGLTDPTSWMRYERPEYPSDPQAQQTFALKERAAQKKLNEAQSLAQTLEQGESSEDYRRLAKAYPMLTRDLSSLEEAERANLLEE
jgi:hypothetical protein